MAFISEERINLFRTTCRRLCVFFLAEMVLVSIPQELLKAYWNSNYSNAGDNFHQEAIALQRQQTALQVQQNRIVVLLAINQNKNKLFSLVCLSVMGTSWTIAVLFGPTRA